MIWWLSTIFGNTKFFMKEKLVGGFNSFEKYSSNWIISPIFGVKTPKIFEKRHHLVLVFCDVSNPPKVFTNKTNHCNLPPPGGSQSTLVWVPNKKPPSPKTAPWVALRGTRRNCSEPEAETRRQWGVLS